MAVTEKRIEALSPADIAYEVFHADLKWKLERDYSESMRSTIYSVLCASGKKIGDVRRL